LALAPCRECGKDVAASAKTCPHCGIEWPADKVQAAASKMQQLGCALTLLVTLPILILSFASLCAA
jgi:uncharacterized membrane protein YvbJ